MQRLLKLEGSAPGFFRIGVIEATLSDGGTIPVLTEELIIVLMRGGNIGRQDLTSEAGIGSSELEEDLDF